MRYSFIKFWFIIWHGFPW